MASKKPAPADDTADTPMPEDVQVVKPVRESDGNDWTVHPSDAGVEVVVRTASGRQCSCTAATEDEARAAILAHLSPA